MIQKEKKKDSYFVLTGNPFVDVGMYAIEAYYKIILKNKPFEEKVLMEVKKIKGENI